MPEVRLCSVDEVEPGSARRFDVGGHRLALVRVGEDEWYCVDDRCSHAEASLAEGTVWAEEREIECPRHGSVFDLRTGAALTLPATRPQGTYRVKVEGGEVVVEVP